MEASFCTLHVTTVEIISVVTAYTGPINGDYYIICTYYVPNFKANYGMLVQAPI